MHPAINIMLQKYRCQSMSEYTNALKEIIQEIALLGLWRAKFFEQAAFYGGTALRIFHGLPRFSEDLDFSLLEKQPDFKLANYNQAIVTELQSFGFKVEIITKIKNLTTTIESTVVKANTKLQLLAISVPETLIESVHSEQTIKIKMEVDTDPPLDFGTESQLLMNPIPFEVNVYQKPDLFASKVHALLCRSWKTRVKGRDWFDFQWYVSQNIPLRLQHLEKRLERSNQWQGSVPLDYEKFYHLMQVKIRSVDFAAAKSDVMPFIEDSSALDLWSQDHFEKILNKVQIL